MSNWQHRARGATLASICFAALGASPAFAQDGSTTSTTPSPSADAAVQTTDAQTQDEAAAASDPEIVVTARRRSEVLQDVPVAVTAYSAEQLERQGALDITDVGDTTPNVTLETSRGTNTTLSAFIRGVGQQDPVAGFEQGVGLYLDDVYLNRPQGALLDIYDVERIEVLRGPQGTLYGRNTIGGAVKYVTRRLSDDPELKVRANLGTYQQADLIVSGSAPLAPGFRIGAAAARLTRGGFGKNLTTGEENYNKDIWASRGTIEYEGGRVFVRLSGDYTLDESNARGGHRLLPSILTAAPMLDDVYDSRGGLEDPEQKVRGGGLALHGDFDLNDWLKLRSITAWRKDRSDTPIDFDALPSVDVDVPAIYKNKQFSQEFQLVLDRGPLAGVAGLYYLDANAFNVFDVRLYTTGPLIGLPGLTAATRGDVDTKTWAAFADFSYDLTDQFSVSLGARYTSDKRHAQVFRANLFNGGSPELGGSGGFGVGTIVGAPTSNFDGKRKDTAFTPRVSLRYEPSEEQTLYASYSKGFKGGGFDPRGLTTSAPDLDGDGVRSPDEIYEFMDFDPETVNSYELGWKGALFDRRLRFAAATFLADYKDVQVPGSLGGLSATGVPTFVGVTTNAGKARFKGFELETNLRLAEGLATAGDRLNLAGTVGFLDAQYREFLTVVTFDEATGLPVPAREVDIADFRKVQNTPKWTMSGSAEYDTPAFGGRLNVNTTVSYRSASQQFELRVPRLDQKGFALLDANLVWRDSGSRLTVGLHGKNLLDKRYISAGYNFFRQNPYTGEFILPNGSPGLSPALGREGTLTAYYGAPRQVFLSVGYNF